MIPVSGLLYAMLQIYVAKANMYNLYISILLFQICYHVPNLDSICFVHKCKYCWNYV